MRRREFISLGVGSVAAVSLGAAFWSDLFDSAGGTTLFRGRGYGPRQPPDENGIRLPEGFSSRIVARGEEPVEGTGYEWHKASDGAAVFPLDVGGWVLVSNSEVPVAGGGVSALRFGADGGIEDAYSILSSTSDNCSGGGTPWGTWLSCEEVESGRVWECDPSGEREAVPREAMGVFKHEAAAVDARSKCVYMSEDLIDGGLYRYTPERWPDLSAGLLEIARVHGTEIEWVVVPDPLAEGAPTREQVPGSTRFQRGEGIWFDGGTLYVATTADHRVHAYDVRRDRIEVVYDGLASQSAPLLRVDQMTGSRAGEVFVCEDIATDEIDIGVIDRDGRVSRFLSVTGPEHQGSELSGVCFDPSGERMYFASQRAFPPEPDAHGPGAVYEISGPFKGARRR
jgi:uncharacterized protein